MVFKYKVVHIVGQMLQKTRAFTLDLTHSPPVMNTAMCWWYLVSVVYPALSTFGGHTITKFKELLLEISRLWISKWCLKNGGRFGLCLCVFKKVFENVVCHERPCLFRLQTIKFKKIFPKWSTYNQHCLANDPQWLSNIHINSNHLRV